MHEGAILPIQLLEDSLNLMNIMFIGGDEGEVTEQPWFWHPSSQNKVLLPLSLIPSLVGQGDLSGLSNLDDSILWYFETHSIATTAAI